MTKKAIPFMLTGKNINPTAAPSRSLVDIRSLVANKTCRRGTTKYRMESYDFGRPVHPGLAYIIIIEIDFVCQTLILTFFFLVEIKL